MARSLPSGRFNATVVKHRVAGIDNPGRLEVPSNDVVAEADTTGIQPFDVVLRRGDHTRGCCLGPAGVITLPA